MRFGRALRSIGCFLLFLEIFFWVGSFVTQTVQSLGNSVRSSLQSDVYKIVCIGESTTLLGGKDSYPSQLENVLNERKPGKFQVINQAMAGVTTDVILNHLPEWINTYQPNMVVAMIGINDPIQSQAKTHLSVLKKIKLVGVARSLKENLMAIFEEYRVKVWAFLKNEQKPVAEPSEGPVLETEHEQFMAAMNVAPQPQKDTYLLTLLAEGQGRDDIAEVLFEKFLSENTNPVIQSWVVKQYGVLLIRRKQYEKFVSVMDRIPPDSWTLEWVKGYCQSEQAMQRVASVIDKMVVKDGRDKLIYSWAASCFEEGGRRDLMEEYLKKSMVTESSYYAPKTRANYTALKDLLLSNDIQPVFVQYPMRDIRPLLSIFEGMPDLNRIIFVDNGTSYRQAVNEKSYSDYFIDRASGDHGHGTKLGNRFLAENVAQAIAGVIP